MERSRDWMNQAEGDLQHAKSDVQGGYYEWACFSAQQAAEKAVKAVRVFYPKFDRAWLVRTLQEGIERLKVEFPIRRVVLFGSYAQQTYTVASDVDLLVIYQGDSRADAYALTKRTLNIPRLEPHLYTEAEYKAVASTVDKMIAGGVVLLSR